MTTIYDLYENQHVVHPSTGHAWLTALRSVLKEGAPAQPRGQQTLEKLGQLFVVQLPKANMFSNSVRAPKWHFAKAEWVWIMSGSNRLSSISNYNPKLEKYADYGYLAGAYGTQIAEQWPYVIRTLTKDQSSRQAVISIWRPRPGDWKDIPCTVSLQFIIRDGCVHCFANMRSNDIWLGMPYDMYVFTQLQRLLACELGHQEGLYFHYVGSLHLYFEHMEKGQAAAAIGVSPSLSPPLTKMPDGFIEAASSVMSGHSITVKFPPPWDGYIADLLRMPHG